MRADNAATEFSFEKTRYKKMVFDEEGTTQTCEDDWQYLYDMLTKHNAVDQNFMTLEAAKECTTILYQLKLTTEEIGRDLSIFEGSSNSTEQLQKGMKAFFASLKLHADKHSLELWLPKDAKRTYKALCKVQDQHRAEKDQSALNKSWYQSSALKAVLVASAVSIIFYSASVNDNEENADRQNSNINPQTAPRHP